MNLHHGNDNSNETIWILGGGKFGQHAALSLFQQSPTADIVIVDEKQDIDLPSDLSVITADAATWLVDNLSFSSNVDKIIPALPLHLAAEWLKKRIIQEGVVLENVEIDDEHLQNLPHPIRQSISQIVISHADFLCPPHCNEPQDLCSYTGKPRPTPLYQLLDDLNFHPFTCRIIRSRQFAPGVGGFYPRDLWKMYKDLLSLPHSPFVLATACKCHGIIDGFILKNM